LAAERGDSGQLAEALSEAENAARTSLQEVRRTVGLLGTDAADGAVSPQPDHDDVGDLVDGYRAAGLVVDLEVRGQSTDISAVTGLVVYRVVQESLANIARHAPGAAASIVIDARVDEVFVEVRNQGGRLVQGPGSRKGLTGMRERVTTLGGTLETGPHGDGWRVTAVFPARVDDFGVCR
jgi:signal transduction histidine kinase